MRRWLAPLYHGEAGSMQADWIILASVLLLGATAGLAAFHQTAQHEWQAASLCLEGRRLPSTLPPPAQAGLIQVVCRP
jgi:hypothetical protein